MPTTDVQKICFVPTFTSVTGALMGLRKYISAPIYNISDPAVLEGCKGRLSRPWQVRSSPRGMILSSSRWQSAAMGPHQLGKSLWSFPGTFGQLIVWIFFNTQTIGIGLRFLLIQTLTLPGRGPSHGGRALNDYAEAKCGIIRGQGCVKVRQGYVCLLRA